MTDIFVRIREPGFHHWPTPSPGRAYLGAPHRHLFGFEVRLRVTHLDREVEFHDLMDMTRAWIALAGPDFGPRSCEMLARELGAYLVDRLKREVIVTVDEDGEAGATVRVTTRDLSGGQFLTPSQL